jgi:nucleoid-associated protein YgaU
MPDGGVATSIQTATVSIPEKLTGPVLALVEEPGKPSRIITAPEKPAEVAAATPATPAAEAPAASSTATTEIAKPADAKAADVKVPDAKPADTAAAPAVEVAIEAVEIEGDKIFIAGKSKGAATVRLFANDVLLGDTKPGEGDRFLAELVHAMPVGDYIIRAEGLAADGVTIVAKASVPFQRVAGDNMSADTTPAAPAKPADTAAATPATPAVVAEVKKAVIIHRGDTLWQISRRVYGHGVRYSTIYLANKEAVEDPNRIYPGQVMTVPAKTTEGENADPAAIEKLNAKSKS